MANFFDDNQSLAFQLQHPLMERIVELKEDNFQNKAHSPYAPKDHAEAIENYCKVLEIVGEICADIIAPNAEQVDAEGPKVVDGRVHYHPGTQKNHDALAKAGLYGMSLPREYNGLNFPMVPYVMAAELVSRADGGFANIWGLQDCAETIHEFASEEQKTKYLPLANAGKTFAMGLTEPDAGSDLQAVMLKAHQDEKTGRWYLNGVKRFITNGDADINLVMARSEEGTKDGRGISLFIYDKRSKAVTVRRIEHKMGIVGSPTCELVFKNAPAELLGSRKLGLIKYVMSLMNGARLGVGAQSVGISEAAYREAEKYAHERVQFGKPIIEFPPVYELLALMRAKTDAIRSLLYETARYVDVYKAITHLQNSRKLTPEERQELKEYQRLADMFTPICKLFASEYCNQITYDAIQIHGGTGFMKDFPVERYYRDARILPIYEGTSQLQVIAAIRGVTTGALAKHIETLVAGIKGDSYTKELEMLQELLDHYNTDVAHLMQLENNEYLDFQGRRLVEMGGLTIMGYLLIIDAERCSCYERSARIFIKYAHAKANELHTLIRTITPDDLQRFKECNCNCDTQPEAQN